ncbi:MAG: hypothetical protein HYX84_04030 [Chloroflexi bacterium]|nr:hypothetical protein [Chloroflexota bacterium]
MDLLISASLVTAFLAGMAALFAPCCIGVLLPTYLASIFRHKISVVLMTFIFFLGILLVFLPMGLGFGALGQVFNEFHDVIFGLGGAFLVLLGLSILLGFHIALPFHVAPSLSQQNVAGIFSLGFFSGLAVACCAPVLAGVLALSALPASVFWGGVYSFVYVFGMVAPLFVIALFLDKTDFTEKFLLFKKGFAYKLGTRKISLAFADLLSAAMFLVVGMLVLYLDITGRLQMESFLQARINILLTELNTTISSGLAAIPGAALIAVLLALVAVLAVAVTKAMRNQK